MLTPKESLKSGFIAVLVIVNILSSFAQTENAVISAIKKEVDRNFVELKSNQSPSPFYISYTVIDQYQMLVKASFGSVTQSEEAHTAWGIPTLYVGSYLVNNEKMDAYTHSSAIEKVNLNAGTPGIEVAIKNALDNRYKVAVKAYEKKKGMLKQMKRTPEEKALPDFEKTPVKYLILSPEKINTDREYWETYASTVSSIAKKYTEIIQSDVTVDFVNAMAYYYNTEGTKFAIPIVCCKVDFIAKLIADDGEALQEHISVSHSSTDILPDIETFAAECEKKIIHLLALKNAPVVDDTYTGPVLCKKEALVKLVGFAFFNNAMMVWHRDLDANYKGMRTLEAKMGEKIISNQLTVKSLSGIKCIRGRF